jgi:hypothetical protein
VSHADLESDSATNLLERNQDVRTNLELMEHTDEKHHYLCLRAQS